MADLRDRITLRVRPKSELQVAAEAAALAAAQTRARNGLCRFDVHSGFNMRRPCLKPAGHKGGCW